MDPAHVPSLRIAINWSESRGSRLRYAMSFHLNPSSSLHSFSVSMSGVSSSSTSFSPMRTTISSYSLTAKHEPFTFHVMALGAPALQPEGVSHDCRHISTSEGKLYHRMNVGSQAIYERSMEDFCEEEPRKTRRCCDGVRDSRIRTRLGGVAVPQPTSCD